MVKYFNHNLNILADLILLLALSFRFKIISLFFQKLFFRFLNKFGHYYKSIA
jgi:hypothetical protein